MNLYKFPLRDVAVAGHASNCQFNELNLESDCKCWKTPQAGLKWRNITASIADAKAPAFGTVIPPGVVVVDVDPRNGGDIAFKQLLDDCPDFPIGTYCIDTGKEHGKHYYLLIDESFKISKKYQGIDFKRYGGYVISAGSHRYDNNEFYTCMNDDKMLSLPEFFTDSTDDVKKPDPIKPIISNPELQKIDTNKKMTIESINKCLKVIPAVDFQNYDAWLKIGISIYRANKDALTSWHEWSITDPVYANVNLKELQSKWTTFAENKGVTSQTLIAEAIKHGHNPATEIVKKGFEKISKKPVVETRDKSRIDEWVFVDTLAKFMNKLDGSFLSYQQLNLVLSYQLNDMTLKEQLNDNWIDRCCALTFEPGLKDYLRDDHGRLLYNRWQKNNLTPEVGNIELFIEFLTYFLKDDYEKLLDWMALVVQFKRPRYMCIIHSLENQIGKGSIIKKILELICGLRNTSFINTNTLKSPYNAYLANAHFIMIEELFGGNQKMQIYNDLKEMITDEYFTINQKHVSGYIIPNRTCYLAFTNYDNALMIKNNDKRALVLSTDKKPLSKKFYKEIINWILHGGGINYIYDFLLKRDVKDLQYQDAPHTSARGEMAYASMSTLDRYMEELVLNGCEKNYSDYFICPARLFLVLQQILPKTQSINSYKIGNWARQKGYKKLIISIHKHTYRMYCSEKMSDKFDTEKEKTNFIRENWKYTLNTLNYISVTV